MACPRGISLPIYNRQHISISLATLLFKRIQSNRIENGWHGMFNTLRLRQNGCHFADILKCIFLHENVGIWIKISLKFVPKDQINNIPALVEIMAWRRRTASAQCQIKSGFLWHVHAVYHFLYTIGNKPLSEPMVAWFSDTYIHHSNLKSCMMLTKKKLYGVLTYPCRRYLLENLCTNRDK